MLTLVEVCMGILISIIGFIWGIFSFIGMCVALIPLLGWFNWFNIPFAAVGVILSIFGFARHRSKLGIGGILLGSLAIIVGLFRLALGGGIL